MAVVKALKSGNWSDLSVWSNGLLPAAGDTVYTNSYDIIVDQDILIGDTNNTTVNAGSFVIGQYYKVTYIGSTNFGAIGGSSVVGRIFLATGTGSGTGTAITQATITNLANTNITAAVGGSITVNTAYNIWASIRSINNAFLVNNATGSFNVLGDIFSVSSGGASYTIRNVSTGTITIVGTVVNFSNGGQNIAIRNEQSGTINIIGTIYSGINTATGAVVNVNVGTINITGTLSNHTYAGHYSAYLSGPVVTNLASGTINHTGTIISGGNGSFAYGIINSGSGGTVVVTGEVYADPNRPFGGGINNSAICTVTGKAYAGVLGANAIISSSAGTLTFNGEIYDNADGTTAIYSPRLRTGTTPIKSVIREALSGSNTFVNFYTPDYETFSMPPVSSVRTGVAYASGGLIGTMVVPSPSAVSFGTPVDNTVGKALLNPADVWNFALSSITVSNSIGAKLSAVATTQDLSATNQLINQKFANLATVSQVGQLLTDALNT